MEDENNISFPVDIPGNAPEDKKDEAPKEKTARRRKKFKAELFDWAKTLFFFCVIPVLIFECFCFVARVPTGSMETTVPAGAEVFTTRCFNKDNIKRGDIVVFYNDELDPTLFKQYIGLRGDIAAFFNDELEPILFKRCIGLPGDTVEFDGTGDVYINGELYEEPYVSSFSDFEGTFRRIAISSAEITAAALGTQDTGIIRTLTRRMSRARQGSSSSPLIQSVRLNNFLQ